ncbi:hypothetical protein, unlikely [Trypanosoma brucei gambiense DAL972]|uniref:Uncharacterized protein n=1 Tax=Trypanosoma brucei gambiense (strain MHOM/CI/86/DAL972) TaxID=679716 RepID=C9ZIU7_TRYB9|nr:hypothetical protein, unlikely [Trypanosoma brucei gambiense DAL972]CBH09089.1 hypothetical protein, unlikely [Trypanosoma brucei gambiense DAL972]|eukprot:XP_011771530.1 hypothetical protein, unlikely [Trypanosoma brucei gambiense DAL972]
MTTILLIIKMCRRSRFYYLSSYKKKRLRVSWLTTCSYLRCKMCRVSKGIVCRGE